MEKRTAICLSGGVDSYILYHLLQNKKKGNVLWTSEHVEPVYVFNFNIPYSQAELLTIGKYSYPIVLESTTKEKQDDGGFINFRNLDVALAVSRSGFSKAYFAATSEDRVSDSSPDFRKQLSFILSESIDKKFEIISPSEQFSKVELVEMYLQYVSNASIERLDKETFSCYEPVYTSPCYRCKACFRKNALLFHFGLFKSYTNSKIARSYYEDTTVSKERYQVNKSYVEALLQQGVISF